MDSNLNSVKRKRNGIVKEEEYFLEALDLLISRVYYLHDFNHIKSLMLDPSRVLRKPLH